MFKSVDVMAGSVMNLLTSNNSTPSTDSSLFEQRVDQLNTDHNETNLCLDEWMNHDELYAAVESVMANNVDLAPITLLCCETIQGKYLDRPLVVLLDGGSSGSLTNRRVLPLGACPSRSERRQITTTASGSFDTSLAVTLKNVKLPEFSNGRRIESVTTRIFNSPTCQYDVILGRDFLRLAGISMSWETDSIKWIDRSIQMKTPHHYDNRMPEIKESIERFNENDIANVYEELYEARTILERKYKEVTPAECTAEQDHMNDEEKQKFEKMLNKHKVLFDGKLGYYPHEKLHLQIKQGSKPVHKKPYPVPYTRQNVFKQELDNLVKDGVLRPCGMTEWASPTFIIPKSNNTVRWVSDFRELNKHLERPQYPVPRIQDIMLKQRGYSHFTKIDLSMMFYCFEMDEESKRLCTITTPFGKYQYNRVPMGIKVSPDFAQSMIKKILQGLDIDAYMDDLGIWTKGSFDDHMHIVDTVLERLTANGMKCNPLKCKWGVKEAHFLGHYMTPDGVTPMRNKIEAVLKLGRPTDKSQVRSFIGAVTFYKSMWPRRSHILAPLHELTGDIPFVWGPRQVEAFETMKAMIAADAMTTYPDLNLPFDIYTDASDYQLGAAILQNGKPIAYWSKKLTESQKNYNTTEKELLAIVMCVKEYHDILYGGRLNVFTDHKNLTFHTLSPPRVMRWKLFLEDYDINLTYVPGKVNVLADAFSRLPRMNGPSPGKNELKGKLIDWNKIVVPKDEQDVFFSYDKEDKDPPILPTICRNDDIEMIELFMNLPTLQEMVCPTTVNNIQQHQAADAALRQTALAYPNTFPIKVINERNLICYRANPEVLQNEWKIYLPQSMIRSVIRWYHMILGHCGFTKVYNTIKARFHAERLSVLCREYVCPENCHMYKQQGRGYGKLPPRHANIAPWNEVCIDLIGPWEIVVNGNICVFKALTCIDPVTNLVELIRIQNKTMVHVAEQFVNSWLSRYPRPNRCVHDNGTEFTGWTFVELLARYGIKDVCTAVRNPQANAICERMHQTIGDILRVVLHTNPPQNMNDANQVMDNALATCMHAMRCSVSAPIGTTPGAMVYGRDMIMDVPLIANLETIRNGRQQMIDENLIKQNKRRIEHHFRVGDRVMQIVWNKSKLSERSSGPFRILATHTNGNITIQRTPTVTDTQSTRWFTPYKGLD